MSKFAASQDRDGNYQVIGAGLPFLAKKTRTYSGAASLGAQGTTTLFTVTGDVMVRVIGACTVDVAGANGTIALGISGNTAALIALSTGTNITAGKSWIDTTPSTAEAFDIGSPFILVASPNIIETIATADLTGGSINFYCFWRPLSSDGNLVAA